MGDGEQLIREVWRRWNDGERSYQAEVFDPEIEIHSALTGQVFAGEDGVNRRAAEIKDQFEPWDVSIADVEQVAPERFIARGSARARGRQSGIDLDQRITWTIDLRDGRILRLANTIGRDSEPQ